MSQESDSRHMQESRQEERAYGPHSRGEEGYINDVCTCPLIQVGLEI